MSELLKQTFNFLCENENDTRVPKTLDIRKLYYDQIHRSSKDESPYFAIINSIHKKIIMYNKHRFTETIYEIPLTSSVSKKYNYFECIKYYHFYKVPHLLSSEKDLFQLR